MTAMIALMEFTYADKPLKPGDRFVVASDNDVRLLEGYGRARRSQDSYSTRTMDTENSGDLLQHSGRGRYRRSDMRAEK